MDILKAAQATEQYVIDCRRHIHKKPELSGAEENTVAFIAAELSRMGIEHVVVPQGGVLGFIGDSIKGKTVLLRADIDALPMQESENNSAGPKAVVSEVPGVAHTCGHDVHTAMLLGAAGILKEHEAKLPGRALLFFERGEEGTGNIYYLLKYMQEHSIHVDGAWGIHVHANVNTGKMVILSGPAMAGGLGFDITVQGKGGHGARPDLSKNPIDCYAAIHSAISQLRVKIASPFSPMSYSICVVDGGTKSNIIPDKVRFGGSCRFYDKADALRFKQEVTAIVDNTCHTYGCTPVYHNFKIGVLPVINNADCADIARAAITRVLGEGSVVPFEPKMGSESFSYLCSYYPSVFASLGVKNADKGMTADTHNPGFDPDEAAMVAGVASTVAYCLDFLADTRAIEFSGFTGNIDEFVDNIDK